MRKIGRKWKGIISVVIFMLLVFYIEVLSYIMNTNNWHPHVRGDEETISTFPDINHDGPLRVLLVADPQIQGENNELPFLGLFTRWDADRYLQRNYLLAKYHVQPHVVIFLGDLFDEGSIATDPEYRRYYRRFCEVFQLPRKQDPSNIEYVFLPGDNDVGGEGIEPVDQIKLKWFNQTFGDFKKELWIRKSKWNVQFLKMNLFLPEEYQNPLKGQSVGKDKPVPDFRILLSHTSLLQYMTNTVKTILEEMRPNIIFAAHSHASSYFQLQTTPKDGFENELKIQHKFLMDENKKSLAQNLFAYSGKAEGDKGAKVLTNLAVSARGRRNENTMTINNDESQLEFNSKLRLNLNKLVDSNKNEIIHEINVPTCSYRMGVPHMGFGAFNLYKNGTIDYTVLWLPSRLNQLYTYMAIYICMKIGIISWVFYKVFCYFVLLSRRTFNFNRDSILYHQV